jgi:phosphate starvation-inducible protein PhoH
MGTKRQKRTATPSGGGRRRDPVEERTYEEKLEDRAYQQLLDERSSNSIIDRMDPDQRTLFEKLIRGSIKQAYLDVPAGYGKTLVAMTAGLTLLRAQKVKRIIYARFPSTRGGKLGYLPGDLEEKQAIYYLPAYEALAKNGMQREAVNVLRHDKHESIIFCTDVTLRGTNLEDAFVIVDEAQNAMDIPELELVLTRFHESIRAAVIGDSRQCDSNVRRYGRAQLNAFQVYIKHMTTEKWAQEFTLSVNHRGPMAKHAAAVDQTLKLLEG